MTGNTNQQSPFSTYAQPPAVETRTQQKIKSPFGEFPDLQSYLTQQDAHAQQRLANQREYNKALSEGRPATKVPTMEAWKQAGDNIKSGAYKGNPFATGNVDGIMSMFDQYGMQTPEGFRDQLIQFLGPQAPPSALTPPPAPGSPFTPSGGIPVAGQQPGMIPKFTNPATGLPYGQEPRGNDGFIDARQPGMDSLTVMVPYYNRVTGETTYRTAGIVPAPGSDWVEAGRNTGTPDTPQPSTSFPAGPNGEYWPGAVVPISSGRPAQSSPQIGGGPVQTGAPHWQPQIGTPVARNPWAPKWGDPGYPVPGMEQQPISSGDAIGGTPTLPTEPGPGLVPYDMNTGWYERRTVYVTPEVAAQLEKQRRLYNDDSQFPIRRIQDLQQAEQDAMAYQNWLRSQGQPGSGDGFIYAPPGSLLTQALEFYVNDITGERRDFSSGGQSPVPGSGWRQVDQAEYDSFVPDGQRENPVVTPMPGAPMPPNASGPGMSQGGPSRQVPGIGVGTPQQPPAFAPGYGGAIDLPPGGAITHDFKDKDGDGVDDRFQPGPGMPRQPPRMPMPDVVSPGMGPEFTNPARFGYVTELTDEQLRSRAFTDSDGDGIDDAFQVGPGGKFVVDKWTRNQWAYPLRPGRKRGPHGEQVEDSSSAEYAKQVAEKQRADGEIPMTRGPRDVYAVRWTPELGRLGYRVTGYERAPQQPTQPAQGQTTKSPPAPAAKPAPVGRANPIPERTQGTPLRRPKPATKKPSAQTRASDRKSQALLNQAMAMLRSGRRL